MLIGRSPVRISFGGGGTDLPSYYEQFGGAVLSTAINKYFYTILGNRDDGRIQVISSDLRLFGNWSDLTALPAQNSGLEIPLAVLKDLGADFSADLFLASEIPPGTGLGSSASVCVNLLKVLTTYLRCPSSKYDLAERAYSITRFGLGRHVGKQDEYAAAFGGLNYIRFGRDGTVQVEPLHLEPGVLSASHGGTVGELDEAAIFYMQSRGLDRPAAVRVIVEGFFEPLIAELQDEALEQLVRSKIERKLAAAREDIETYATSR